MGITSGAAAALQIGGAVNSAIGAQSAAQGQRDALTAQAGLDVINARSAASSLDAQAGLDSINAQAVFGATGAQAAFDRISSEGSALTLRTEAAIGASRAQTTAAGLEAGAVMADNSAKLQELQAQSALLTGEREEQGVRLQTAQLKSRQTATMAARGLDLGEGTPLAVLTSTDLMGEHTAIGIQQQALLAALGHRTQAANAATEADVKRLQASMVEAGSRLDTTLATTRADTLVANANAAADAKIALASAGLANAEAAAAMKRVTAETLRINSSAAASVRRAQAAGIDPTSAAASSLLAGAGQVAGNWYLYNKSTAGK